MHSILHWLGSPCEYSNFGVLCNLSIFCWLAALTSFLWRRVAMIESDIYEEVPADETA
jgi:hypothetical protein